MRIVFTLYATTFIVANSADSLCSELAPEALAAPVVFVSTFAFNVPLGVWKDVRFSQLFVRPGKAGRGVQVAKLATTAAPKPTTAAFLVRDAITIFGSFTLPGWVSEGIPKSLMPDPASREVLTQMMVPMLSQVAATPIHLLGLDLYSRQDGAGMRQRLSRTRKYVPGTTTARCFRIIPAFGIGVLANKHLRANFQGA